MHCGSSVHGILCVPREGKAEFGRRRGNRGEKGAWCRMSKKVKGGLGGRGDKYSTSWAGEAHGPGDWLGWG